MGTALQILGLSELRSFLCIRGVSQEKDGQISSAIVSSVQSKITQVRWGAPSLSTFYNAIFSLF